jgi:hypothetical protein
MKPTKAIPRLIVTVAVSALAPFAGEAYVDVELNSGRHVIGQSYTDQGGKLIVFRPSGAIELDRTSVRSIQEPAGDMPSEVGVTASSLPVVDAVGTSAPKGQAGTATRTIDPATRERELAHQLIDVRLNRLAATQRSDDEAIKKLDKQIKSLQGEREANWKKLHPHEDQDSSD